MAVKLYEVLREHHGDRPYAKGDERALDEMAAKHLVGLKVLQLVERDQAHASEDPVAKVRADTDAQIAALVRKVADASEAAATELGVIANRTAEARIAAEAEIMAIRNQVAETRAQADIELAEIAAEIAAAKAEQDAASKAEAAPANKAEGAADANKAGGKAKA